MKQHCRLAIVVFIAASVALVGPVAAIASSQPDAAPASRPTTAPSDPDRVAIRDTAKRFARAETQGDWPAFDASAVMPAEHRESYRAIIEFSHAFRTTLTVAIQRFSMPDQQLRFIDGQLQRQLDLLDVAEVTVEGDTARLFDRPSNRRAPGWQFVRIDGQWKRDLRAETPPSTELAEQRRRVLPAYLELKTLIDEGKVTSEQQFENELARLLRKYAPSEASNKG